MGRPHFASGLLSMSTMFDALKKGGATGASPVVVASGLTAAIQDIDRLFSIVVSNHLCKERQIPARHSNAEAMAMLAVAKKAAQEVLKAERSGAILTRVFSAEHWESLIKLTSLDVAQNFCASPSMHPSICARIVVSMQSIDT